MDAIRSDERIPKESFVATRRNLALIVGPADGRFSSLMEILDYQLEFVLPSLQTWSWHGVRSAATRLAARLLEQDPAEPTSIHGIPRGGLIVASLVAYAAGAQAATFNGELGGRCWLIDDIAISGLRMLETLDRYEDASATVGLLAATDGAVEAIGAHPAVMQVIRAETVQTVEPLDEQTQREWQARWPEYDSRIWFGLCHHHAFPWREPDSVFKNRQTGESEHGFPLVSRRHCLSTKDPHVPILGTDGSLEPLFEEHIWPVHHADRLLLVNSHGGSVHELTGSAKPLLLALNAPDTTAAVAELSSKFDVSEETLKIDITELADALRTAGLCFAEHGLKPQ